MGRGGGILTRWQGGARFKVDSHSVYQLFLQDTGKKKKKKTKPSGFVKRRRVSFRAVSEHSHSALNGSPVTSEK